MYSVHERAQMFRLAVRRKCSAVSWGISPSLLCLDCSTFCVYLCDIIWWLISIFVGVRDSNFSGLLYGCLELKR